MRLAFTVNRRVRLDEHSFDFSLNSLLETRSSKCPLWKNLHASLASLHLSGERIPAQRIQDFFDDLAPLLVVAVELGTLPCFRIWSCWLAADSVFNARVLAQSKVMFRSTSKR